MNYAVILSIYTWKARLVSIIFLNRRWTNWSVEVIHHLHTGVWLDSIKLKLCSGVSVSINQNAENLFKSSYNLNYFSAKKVYRFNLLFHPRRRFVQFKSLEVIWQARRKAIISCPLKNLMTERYTENKSKGLITAERWNNFYMHWDPKAVPSSLEWKMCLTQNATTGSWRKRKWIFFFLSSDLKTAMTLGLKEQHKELPIEPSQKNSCI